MDTEDIQKLRKDLKQWESAFYIVHQRKPEKKDISEAPKEIKEKYQVYYKKRTENQEKRVKDVSVDDVLSQNAHHEVVQVKELKDQHTDNDVWSTEFNKTQSTKKEFEAEPNKSINSRASLEKLGAKLFQTFTSKPPPSCVRSVKLQRQISSGPTQKVPSNIQTGCLSLQFCDDNKDNTVNKSIDESGDNAADFVGQLQKPSSAQNVQCSGDDVIQGNLFKSAEKLFLSKGAAFKTCHQIPKPRTSFLNSNIQLSFKDGNLSDEEVHEKDILQSSGILFAGDGDLKSDSDVGTKNGGIYKPENANKLSPDLYTPMSACKEKKSAYNKSKLQASHKTYEQAQDKQNSGFHEHLLSNDDDDLFLGKRTSELKYSNKVPRVINTKQSTSKSNPKLTRKKNVTSHPESKFEVITPTAFTLFEENENNLIKRDASLQQSCNDQSIQSLESAKSVKLKKTARSEKHKTSEPNVTRSTLQSIHCGQTKSPDNMTLTVTDNSETNTVIPQKCRPPKRKRTFEVSEDCSSDLDHAASESQYDESEEPAIVKESNISTQKSAQRQKSEGSLSDNYVCLNMKRKGYRRKGAGMTGAQLRRKQWKAKMASRSKSFGSNKCFKCGQEGHWANKCKGQPGSNNNFNHLDIKALPVEESDFPSLREAALMSRGIKDDEQTGKRNKNLDDITDIEATIVRDEWDSGSKSQPSSRVSFAEQVKDFKSEVKQALSMFGFSSFKPGQEDSIYRVLHGLSTLVVLSTGGGKSLCYQLPAYLYAKHFGSLTLVISPLVSLMDDQITGLPPGVYGACLHSGMTLDQREKVIVSVREGKVHFLLVSPEAIVEGGANKGSFPPPGRIPPIAFACIDEAHCLSEWSHNFRPSYLRLCKVLRRRYNVNCFLGLTATATKSTAEDVARHLGIADTGNATIRGAAVPSNLVLSVSRDENKDEALISLLKGDRFKTSEGILIYCARRDHTERVATLIRTTMKTSVDLNASYQPTAKKRRATKTFDSSEWTAESYHAGLTAAKRRSVQKAFMTGKLRVVVATVAFGMGLDKANVRVVIHYNIAKSFESYVQEIGRAGRDGQVAHCHVFLDSQNKDLCELKRHTFSNSVDRIILKKMLSRIFIPCRCREIYKQTNKQETTDDPIDEQCLSSSHEVCGGHERAMSIQETVQLLDVKEEGIATLLSYLELHPECFIENMNHVYARCSIKCYQGPRQLMDVAKKCPPVAVAIARQKLEGKHFSERNQLDFNVIEVCDSMGWDSGTVKRELMSLQWDSSSGVVRKTGVCVELSDLAFHYRSRGDLTPNQIDRILDFIYSRTQQQERTELEQLHLLSRVLRSVSHKSYFMCCDDADIARSDKLKEMLRKYFDNEEIILDKTRIDESLMKPSVKVDSHTLSHLSGDIRQFISIYGQDHMLTGRCIARIFHGIASPNFPAETWGRVRRFWRAHLNVDFNLVTKEATQILVSLK